MTLTAEDVRSMAAARAAQRSKDKKQSIEHEVERKLEEEVERRLEEERQAEQERKRNTICKRLCRMTYNAGKLCAATALGVTCYAVMTADDKFVPQAVFVSLTGGLAWRLASSVGRTALNAYKQLEH